LRFSDEEKSFKALAPAARVLLVDLFSSSLGITAGVNVITLFFFFTDDEAK
jgi:hypothetical protein